MNDRKRASKMMIMSLSEKLPWIIESIVQSFFVFLVNRPIHFLLLDYSSKCITKPKV